MIVYYKLDKLLDERKITKTQLCKDTGISTNVVSKISKNEVFKTDTLNRICEYLHAQPCDIMEWIPDTEYNAQNTEIASIDAQIAELQARKKELQGIQINLHNSDDRGKEEHNIPEKKIVHKVPENIRRQSIETLKVRKESLEYLRTNGFKTIDDIIDRQNEIPTEIIGNIYAYIMFGMED